jgi:hypothetical protein
VTRVEEPRQARTSLPEEVRRIASALAELLDKTAGLPTHVRTPVRVVCEAVSRRLNETRLTLALVGDAGAGRRTLVNALLGERVLPTHKPRRGSTTTIVRRAPALGFWARSLDGRLLAELSHKMPDRQALFEKSMAQIDRETDATEQLAARLRAARERAAALETVPEPSTPLGSPRAVAWLWQAIWSWILRVLLSLPWLKRLPRQGTSGDEARPRTLREQRATRVAQREQERAAIAALEGELAAMRSVEQIAAQAQRLRQEREKYEGERRAAFLSQVRDFDGTDTGERIVEYPARYLPEGLTLVDLPCPPVAGAPVVEQIRNRVARDVDALVVVADVRQPMGEVTVSLVRELGDLVPVVLVVLTKADGALKVQRGGTSDDVPSEIEHIRRDAFDRIAGVLGPSTRRTPCVALAAEAALEAPAGPSPLAEHFHATIGALWISLDGERPILLAWREAMRMRGGLAELTRAQAREEESCRTRLSSLEGKRLPDPAEFRGRLLKRVDGAIEKGADDVLAAATQGLHTAIEGLRAAWNGRISSCTARGDVDACIAAINESAAARIAEALEQTAELVARELHDVTETLETWAIEEIHAHYRLMRRLGAEALAPVASELTREDLESELLAVQPFEGALDAFEKGRVGFGLGGVAAGAVLGTLIAPGIGTAVGAVLGVLAGLLKGTDSLKQECIAKIDACLNEVESHARAQLQNKRPDLSRVVRVTLDEALGEALLRLNDAIARLRAIERRAIERERAKLEELAAGRRTLAELDSRLTRLVERALDRVAPATPA